MRMPTSAICRLTAVCIQPKNGADSRMNGWNASSRKASAVDGQAHSGNVLRCRRCESSVGAGLAARIEQFIEAIVGNAANFSRYLAHCTAAAIGFLGNRGRLLITDHRRKNGTHGERLLHESRRTVVVCLQAFNRAPAEVAGGRG